MFMRMMISARTEEEADFRKCRLNGEKVVENMSKPVVAIVGRPNVGKSTLFNTLAEADFDRKERSGCNKRPYLCGCIAGWTKNLMIDTGGIEPGQRYHSFTDERAGADRH